MLNPDSMDSADWKDPGDLEILKSPPMLKKDESWVSRESDSPLSALDGTRAPVVCFSDFKFNPVANSYPAGENISVQEI